MQPLYEDLRITLDEFLARPMEYLKAVSEAGSFCILLTGIEGMADVVLQNAKAFSLELSYAIEGRAARITDTRLKRIAEGIREGTAIPSDSDDDFVDAPIEDLVHTRFVADNKARHQFIQCDLR